jgi:hypothetical protein
MRINNWLVMIYTADHLPAHVHVIGPGWTVIVNLRPVEVRQFRGCTERQAIAARDSVAEHRLELMAKWRAIHG